MILPGRSGALSSCRCTEMPDSGGGGWNLPGCDALGTVTGADAAGHDLGEVQSRVRLASRRQ